MIGISVSFGKAIAPVMLYFSMGERAFYQPLTKEDRITVLLYRSGIFLSTAILSISAVLAVLTVERPEMPDMRMVYSGFAADLLILALYFSVGLSVFFIHLYVGKFHRALKKTYYLAAVCFAALFILGKGSPAAALLGARPLAALLVMPLSLCLGFITAKEAFCFQLIEGYLLAFLMPAFIFLYSVGLLGLKNASYGLGLIAAMLLFFMFRKVFQPLQYDIGDKSAYQP
ncbi:MAG: DUF2301 domain-containing membrane protein [Nitrospiraceae bacterium]|nr:DUF2301 domain-containing membrane protein [Nitrospiraceae bacterium]